MKKSLSYINLCLLLLIFIVFFVFFINRREVLDINVISPLFQARPSESTRLSPLAGEASSCRRYLSRVSSVSNKYGLYIYSEDWMIDTAEEMLNSNGGSWGYVLIPVNIKDTDKDKWVKLMNNLQSNKLIPIFQLWDGSPDLDEARKETEKFAKVFSELPWFTDKWYISVYNEVNAVDMSNYNANPELYASVLDTTIDIFKSEDSRYFMMNGAFNASARTTTGYLDEEQFLLRMNRHIPNIFDKLDGWASHPYPHVNGYLGRPLDIGRDSIKGYDWELGLLKKHFGVSTLPVFITETGWPHAEGKEGYRSDYYPENVVADYYRIAFEEVWNPDPRVIGVMPFTIKYDPPYDYFSFIKDNREPYKPFTTIQNLQKNSNNPNKLPTDDSRYTSCLRYL